MSTRIRKPASDRPVPGAKTARARKPAAAAATTAAAPAKLAKSKAGGTAAKKGTLKRVATRSVAGEAAPRKRASKVERTPDRSAAAGAAGQAPRKAAAKLPSQRGRTVSTIAPLPGRAAASALPKKRGRVTPEAQVEALRLAVMHALEEVKAKDVVVLDVRQKTSVTDYFVIATGTSSRHAKSLADEVIKAAKELKLPPLGVEGEREGDWIVVDLGDLVIHVMQPRPREFYALERLWGVGEVPLGADLS